MGKISIFKNKNASIGIGALIVFIAIILVAGVAASVMIQTGTHVELRAYSAGRETTREVASGLAIYSIEAYAAAGSDISKLAIMVRPRAGSTSIDLSHTHIEISDKTTKVILNYTSSNFSNPDGVDDIFSADVYPDDNFGYHHSNNTDGSRFGILVLEDADGSMTSTNPSMNRGDKAYLCINTTGVFNDIAENTEVFGQIIPDVGYSAMIEFWTPLGYHDNVMEILLDI